METGIQEFIQLKRMAVVGVSKDEKKFGNAIYKELKSRGFQVYAVNPGLKEYAGEPCYPNLEALKGKIDGAVVCVQPSRSADVVCQAANTGIHHVWLQQGAESEEAVRVGKELGLNLISGKCILMYAPPVQSMHNVHRFFVKMFGKL